MAPTQAHAAPAGTSFTLLDAERLLAVVGELSYLRDLDGVMAVVRRAARDLTAADGVTFVLRDGDQVWYAEENAIAPLWKGRRFPLDCCISGWAIRHRDTVVIEDVFADPRIPQDLYRPTFVRSLAMVPIRIEDPLGAIGAYWARPHRASAREVALLASLAGTTAVAMANAELFREARDAIRVRDEFISIASHELKTPLTPLKLKVQGLQRRLARGADVELAKAELARIDLHVARVERLVDNLLDISRITRGMLRLELEEVELSALVREVIERHRPELERAGSPIELHAPSPVAGRWDRVRLEEVTSNLISNAIKYGTGKAIDVTIDGEAGIARLAVRDLGIGIPPEDQARIFDRFEHAASVRHFGGFGLGLWLSRQIVEAHGGTISVDSRFGEGSQFTVELPRAPREPRNDA